MTSTSLLSAVLVAALFLGAGWCLGPGRNPALVALDARCQDNKSAVFTHPGYCHLYFNCSDNSTTVPWYFTPHLKKCRYPQLFSVVTSRCEKFDDVTCGDRVELVDHCEYHVSLCPGYMCGKCDEWFPSCKGLPDGLNPFRGNWSPYYAVCRSQRTVGSGRCPSHGTLQIAQLLHPEKRRCVSLYEIPKQHGGLELKCTNKPDGLHLDDVTNRPDVYFRCFDKKFVDVQRCTAGKYFDELQDICSANPLYNRIMTPDERGPQ